MRYLRQIAVDGDHILSGSYLVPATDIYQWRATEVGHAWPLHLELGQTDRSWQMEEHRPTPGVSPWVSPTERREWHPRGYEEAVVRNLMAVFGSASGHALSTALNGRCLIVPSSVRDPVLDSDNNPLTSGNEVFRPQAGIAFSRLLLRTTGPVVEYTPGHFPRRYRASSLFHELVHIARVMAGVYRAYEPAHNFQRYTIWEEFPAVVIENVFRSETHVGQLRWGHYDITRPLLNPDTWLEDPGNRAAVSRIIDEMRRFTHLLARVETRFNPFRDVFRERGLGS